LWDCPECTRLAHVEATTSLRADLAKARDRGDRMQIECARLDGVLRCIDGGDNPVLDEAMLRQWAYEATTLGRGVGGLSTEVTR